MRGAPRYGKKADFPRQEVPNRVNLVNPASAPVLLGIHKLPQNLSHGRAGNGWNVARLSV